MKTSKKLERHMNKIKRDEMKGKYYYLKNLRPVRDITYKEYTSDIKYEVDFNNFNNNYVAMESTRYELDLNTIYRLCDIKEEYDRVRRIAKNLKFISRDNNDDTKDPFKWYVSITPSEEMEVLNDVEERDVIFNIVMENSRVRYVMNITMTYLMAITNIFPKIKNDNNNIYELINDLTLQFNYELKIINKGDIIYPMIIVKNTIYNPILELSRKLSDRFSETLQNTQLENILYYQFIGQATKELICDSIALIFKVFAYKDIKRIRDSKINDNMRRKMLFNTYGNLVLDARYNGFKHIPFSNKLLVNNLYKYYNKDISDVKFMLEKIIDSPNIKRNPESDYSLHHLYININEKDDKFTIDVKIKEKIDKDDFYGNEIAIISVNTITIDMENIFKYSKGENFEYYIGQNKHYKNDEIWDEFIDWLLNPIPHIIVLRNEEKLKGGEL